MLIDYISELNEEQLDVVQHADGPCLVLAGAGSGKTRTVTYRVASLLEHGVPASQILLLTFTNKAAREMLSRVQELAGPAAAGIWGGTFHSVANRILRLHAPFIGRTSSFTILDEEDARELLKLCIKEVGVDSRAQRFPSPAALHSILSYARNASRPVREAVLRKSQSFQPLISSIEEIDARYEARKQEANSLDFDDLLLLLRGLFANHPDVRDQWASRFRYILVDEYQDTKPIQADIVRMLASVHGNLLAVGDDAQSIYSFRAADIRNILRFPDQFPGAHIFRLTTNYRSTPDILKLANAVIANNKDQFRKELKAIRPAALRPLRAPAVSAKAEARYIADRVGQLMREGTPLSHMAVLFRAAFLSQALEFELMQRGIPYEYRGGLRFFDRAHVKDVVSHLRVIANPRDEAAWIRVLGIQPGIGISTAGHIVEYVRTCQSAEDLLLLDPNLGARASEGWVRCRELLRRALAGSRLPSDLIRNVVMGGYRDYAEAEFPDAADRLDDIEQLARFAGETTDLRAFLDDVSLTESFGSIGQSRRDTGDDRLVLSTIHQAKGLEWEAVFVIGLTGQSFPNPRALEEEGGLEEERRLFYVAATRAKEKLFLTYPVSGGYDAMTIQEPSLFLQEIPKGVCEDVRAHPDPSSFFHSSDRDDDRIIVLDELGERQTERPRKTGEFLRSLEDL